MKISECLKVETINLDLQSKDKKGALKELFLSLAKQAEVKDEKKCYEDLMEREKLGSTGIGKGVAIPHAKTDGVDNLIMTIGISKHPIPYESVDSDDARIFFMFLAPLKMSHEYLVLLAKISRYIREDQFRDALLTAKSAEEVAHIIALKDM